VIFAVGKYDLVDFVSNVLASSLEEVGVVTGKGTSGRVA
jgi:ADP-glucose pyrophosphorylase